MSIFKPTYKDKKTGKKKKISKWWIELRDHQEIVKRFAAYTDKRQSEVLETKIKQLIACKKNGESPTAEPGLTDWLNVMDGKLRDRLIEIGLLDASKAMANKSLTKLLDDFEQFLKAKERTQKYVKGNKSALACIFADCSFRFWSDISATQVMAYLKRLRDEGMSYGRSNTYLAAGKMFCNWMVIYQGMAESPLRYVKPLDSKLDPRHKRRVIELDELRRLLETTRNAPTRFGMTGYERYLLYKLATETGLRANEIRTLTVGSFDFANLTVIVKSAYSKHRREDVVPLRPDTAALLREFFKGKLPGVKAFGGTYKALESKTAKILRADLEDAGIPYEVDGLYFDFHSIRHEAGTLLAATGVHPKVAQSILRHQDINLTLSLYTHTLRGQESEAVKNLPDLSAPSSENQKTGTDDLGSGLPLEGGKQ